MGTKEIIEVVEPIKFHFGQFVRHLASNNCYQITGTPYWNRIEETGEPSYAYKNADDITYHRSQAKMEDGRFVQVHHDFNNGYWPV